jgi:hypothetical protein
MYDWYTSYMSPITQRESKLETKSCVDPSQDLHSLYALLDALLDSALTLCLNAADAAGT